MTIAIRLASSGDAKACAEIVNNWIDATDWMPRVHSREAIEEMIAAGVVLTGGSSKMEGVVELAEEIFHVPVRLGLPQYVSGLSDVVNNPIHATGVGLLLFGYQHQDSGQSHLIMEDGFKGLFARMKSWFQGNF